MGPQRCQGFRMSRRDGMHVDGGSQRADFVHEDLRIGDQVRLVQHDHRRGAALPGDDEIALEAPRIEVVIETADEKHGVDVGSDDLFFGGIAGRAPREPAGPGQHGLDAGVAGLCRRLDGDPVADGGEIGRARGVVPQPSGHPRQPFLLPGQHTVDVRVLEADARRYQPVAPIGLEQLVEPSRPAKRLQLVGHSDGETVGGRGRGRRSAVTQSAVGSQRSAVRKILLTADRRPSTAALKGACLVQASQHFGDAPGLRDAAAGSVRRLRRRRSR